MFGAAKIGFNTCFKAENGEFFGVATECFVKAFWGLKKHYGAEVRLSIELRLRRTLVRSASILSNGFSRNPPTRPCVLKIKSTGNTINI